MAFDFHGSIEELRKNRKEDCEKVKPEQCTFIFQVFVIQVLMSYCFTDQINQILKCVHSAIGFHYENQLADF